MGEEIGYITTLTFANVGAEVIGLDRKFPQDSYPLMTETLDMANTGQVTEVCQRVLETRERLDVLVNTTGILRIGATDTLGAEEWQQTFVVNVSEALNLFQQATTQFHRQQSETIVTVASDAVRALCTGISAYGASKAVLKSLALTVKPGLADSSVCCNVMSPDSTNTDMQRTLWVSDDVEQQRIRRLGGQFRLEIPLGKVARPQEIANIILFLVSGLINYITLQDIVVDGGSMLGA